MRRHDRDGSRGAQFVSAGEDVMVAGIDRRRSSGADGIDWSTHRGALLLARRIEEFWGGAVRVRVESQAPDTAQAIGIGFYVLRSDLVNGLPNGEGRS